MFGGGDQNNVEMALAAVRLQEEAELGNVRSQYRLATHYEDGRGVKQNMTEALKWYLRAADQNDLEAQVTLGYIHDVGRNVKRDDVEANLWYRKAAEQGDPWSQVSLGFKYVNGNGVPRDLQEALRWLAMAAEQGEAQAQYYMGICYRDGFGTKRDRIQAYKWLDLAALQESTHPNRIFDRARKHRDELEKGMTTVQVAEAQKLASAFVPQPKLKTDRPSRGPVATVKSLGAGFFVTPDGFFVTHVGSLRGAKKISLRT